VLLDRTVCSVSMAKTLSISWAYSLSRRSDSLQDLKGNDIG